MYSCHEPYLRLLLLSWLSWRAYFPSGVVSHGSQTCNSPYKSHTVRHTPFSSAEVCLNHIRSQSMLYYSIHIYSMKQLHVLLTIQTQQILCVTLTFMCNIDIWAIILFSNPQGCTCIQCCITQFAAQMLGVLLRSNWSQLIYAVPFT